MLLIDKLMFNMQVKTLQKPSAIQKNSVTLFTVIIVIFSL